MLDVAASQIRSQMVRSSASVKSVVAQELASQHPAATVTVVSPQRSSVVVRCSMVRSHQATHQAVGVAH